MTREELNKEKQKKITEEENREKRKKIIILTFKMVLILIISFVLFYLYTTYVSTSSLIVKEERIVNNKLPNNFNGLKIIQFSDLHYGSTIFEDELQKVVKEINKRKPDLVLFTGDLIDEEYDLSTKELEKVIKQLKKIDASLGKYAVGGEEDSSNSNTIFNQSDFIVLNNNYELIYKDDSNPILLVGLSSLLKEQRDIDKSYSYFLESTHNSDIFTISMLHEPDSVSEILEKYPTDLFLAGHSHNGNIRVPYVGALKKEEGAREYDQSFYQIDSSKLYISSGIGTNGLGFRLFCRPSINFFRLSQK